MSKKPPITRLAKLRQRDGLFIGMDFQDLFKEGIVYNVTEIMGVIMITPLGKMALPKDGRDNIVPNDHSTLSTILCGSAHLMTKEEYNNR